MPTDFRLPPTGITYSPQRRHNRRQFEEYLAATPDAMRVMEWFLGFGVFAPAEDNTPHPAFVPDGEVRFIDSVRRGYMEYGMVTANQLAALGRIMRDRGADSLAVSAAQALQQVPGAPTRGEHFGAVGERHRLSLTVDRNVPTERKPGHYVCVMQDSAGRVFTLRTPGLLYPEGQTVTMRATILSHHEFRNTRETRLTDAKIMQARKPRRVFDA